MSDFVAGIVYVIDIDPNSDTYNQCVRTIPVPTYQSLTGFSGGLRGLAFSSDGSRLAVAVPSDAKYLDGGDKPGYIDVINTSTTSDRVDLRRPDPHRQPLPLRHRGVAHRSQRDGLHRLPVRGHVLGRDR